MLVFKLRVGERMMIETANGVAVVQVAEIRGDGSVRLAMDAPDDIRIDRENVFWRRYPHSKLVDGHVVPREPLVAAAS